MTFIPLTPVQPLPPSCLSQASLWSFLHEMPDPIVVKDRQQQWVAFNEAFCRLLGQTREQLSGKSDDDFLPPTEARALWQMGEHVFATGTTQTQQITITIQTKSQPVTVQMFLFNSPGEVPYLATCLRPATSTTPETTSIHAGKEAVLEYNAATSRALIEAIPDLLIRMKSDGTILNLSLEGNFKPTAIIPLVGRSVYDYLPSAAAELRKEYVRKALETKQLQVYDQELILNGQLIYEEVRVIPCGDDEVLSMIRDVTSQRRAEFELQQLNEQLESQVEARTAVLKKVVTRLEQEINDRKLAKAQLQEKEQFLRSIYDGIEHQVFVIDVTPEGQFRYAGWNQHSERVVGISSEAAVGKTPEEAMGYELGKAVRQKYQTCLQSGKSVIYEESLNFQGEIVWSITTLNPLTDNTGRVYRIVGTAFDITDRKQAELALQASETQLRQQATELQNTLQELQQMQMQLVQSEKMSGLGQLVAGVAHEINNPVNFIYGNLKHAGDYTQELLNLIHLYQRYYPDPVDEIQQNAEAIDLDFLMEDLPKLLKSMKVGAERIQQIVASLRTFSRMDEAEMKAVDLAEGIESTLMILQNRLKAKPDRPKVEVVKHYSDLPLIECYAGQLNQVFMNILSNAIDALEDKIQANVNSAQASNLTPTLTIRTHQPTPDLVQIAIADNGSGIPDELKPRIFDPFFTTKAIGKGTGMGLSISYQIVTEKHQGTLSCHSTPGSGTEFVIEIPIRQSVTALRIED